MQFNRFLRYQHDSRSTCSLTSTAITIIRATDGNDIMRSLPAPACQYPCLYSLYLLLSPIAEPFSSEGASSKLCSCRAGGRDLLLGPPEIHVRYSFLLLVHVGFFIALGTCAIKMPSDFKPQQNRDRISYSIFTYNSSEESST